MHAVVIIEVVSGLAGDVRADAVDFRRELLEANPVNHTLEYAVVITAPTKCIAVQICLRYRGILARSGVADDVRERMTHGDHIGVVVVSFFQIRKCRIYPLLSDKLLIIWSKADIRLPLACIRIVIGWSGGRGIIFRVCRLLQSLRIRLERHSWWRGRLILVLGISAEK